MNRENSLLLNEGVLNSIGARTLRLIKEKGERLETDILSKLTELEKMIMEGSCRDGLVTVQMDGNHCVLDIRFSPDFTHWSSDSKRTSALLMEAINDAKFKIDLIIEKEISIIQYNALKAVIEGASKE